MTWFYCSFASEDAFLGSIVVKAESLEFAVIESHRLGINPGGQCLGYPLRESDVPDEKHRNRLLTRDEVNEIWPGQMVRLGDMREEMDELSKIVQECNGWYKPSNDGFVN